MTSRKTIKKFIEKLNIDPPITANFKHGLSYWWAAIMQARFGTDNDITDLIFNPTTETFAVVINGEPWNPYGPIPLSEIDDYMEWSTFTKYHPEDSMEISRIYIYMMDKKEWEEFCANRMSSL